MEVRWRADIDHIDIWPIARFRKTAGDLWDPVLFRYGRSALAVEVAQKLDSEEIRECLKALDMLGPDSGTDDCDLQINTNETESIPLTEYFPVFLIPLFLQSLLCSDPKFRLSIWLGGRLAVQAVGLRQLTKA